MKYTVLFIALFFSLNGICQPVIPASSIPGPGTNWVQTLTEDMPDPGPAGANQTWDFSAVTLEGFSFETEFVNPGNTPYGGLFPMASLAGSYLLELDTITESFYEYYQVVGGSLLVLGEASSFTTTTYSDPQVIPYVNMTFGSMVTDDYVSTTNSSFGSVTTYGMTSHHYDGYGSINLPMGMVSEVIRMHEFDISVDTSDVGYGGLVISYDTSEIYAWIVPSSILPIATWEESRGRSQTYFNGVLINDQYEEPEVSFGISTPGMSGADDVLSNQYANIAVYYQPGMRKLHIDLGGEIENPDFVIYTADGKQLLNIHSESFSSQQHTIEIPLSTNPGIYFLNIDDRISKKFIVPME